MSQQLLSFANALIESKALKFGTFTLKSGKNSPYYIDLSQLLSSPQAFQTVVGLLAAEIRQICHKQPVDQLASIELKGALLLPSIAVRVNLPCVVVRKESKGYGVTGRIAGGEVMKGERVLFFDDVVSTGQSKLEGIRPLELLGAYVDTVIVVIDREQGGKEHLEKHSYGFKAFTTISKVVQCLVQYQKISTDQANMIYEFINNN